MKDTVGICDLRDGNLEYLTVLNLGGEGRISFFDKLPNYEEEISLSVPPFSQYDLSSLSFSRCNLRLSFTEANFGF